MKPCPPATTKAFNGPAVLELHFRCPTCNAQLTAPPPPNDCRCAGPIDVQVPPHKPRRNWLKRKRP